MKLIVKNFSKILNVKYIFKFHQARKKSDEDGSASKKINFSYHPCLTLFCWNLNL